MHKSVSIALGEVGYLEKQTPQNLDDKLANPGQDFTYYLLNKLRETKGEVTLGELGKYLNTEVNRQSVLTNKKKQTPEVVTSRGFNGWETIKLK